MFIGVLLLFPDLLSIPMQSTLLLSSPALSALGQTLIFGSVCILAFAFILGRVSTTVNEPVGPESHSRFSGDWPSSSALTYLASCSGSRSAASAAGHSGLLRRYCYSV